MALTFDDFNKTKQQIDEEKLSRIEPNIIDNSNDQSAIQAMNELENTNGWKLIINYLNKELETKKQQLDNLLDRIGSGDEIPKESISITNKEKKIIEAMINLPNIIKRDANNIINSPDLK